jgi:glycosyltransferase involved in cell wall biosynthesis
MKVLVVTPSYPVADNPQAAVFVHRQVQNLSACGVDCHVLVFRPAPPPFPRWLASRTWLEYRWKMRNWPRVLDGVPVATVFYDRAWTANEDVVPAIGRALVRHVEARPELEDTDVVYAHWLWPGGAAALALRERYGWPVAAIARGSEMHDWQASKPQCRAYVERVLRDVDLPLANCQDLRDRADGLVPGSAARAEVIYNGCDAERFRPAENRDRARSEVGFAPGERILLFCGDVISRKGVYELAEAWPRFAAGYSRWRLVVVGNPVERVAVKRLEDACGDRLTIVGRVPHERVVTFLQAADAFVQPSRLEGLANATMEAMATGLPVITTDTCGQRELVRNGENGWLVPTHDSEALARAMCEMSGDEQTARRYGDAARRTIVDSFDPRREATRLSERLAALAAGAIGAPMSSKG